MKRVVIIPARMGSTRFPGKLLMDIDGQTLLKRCYEDIYQATVHMYETGVSSQIPIYIATPDKVIVEEVSEWASSEKIIKTPLECRNGTERVAMAAKLLGLEDEDIIVNTQADQYGFSDKGFLEVLMSLIEHGANLATAVCPLQDSDLENRHVVKASVDVKKGEVDIVSWFARTIPNAFHESVNLYRHVGIYAARKKMFDWYLKKEPTGSEKAFDLEQLRWKHPFAVGYLAAGPVTIDTPNQLRYNGSQR